MHILPISADSVSAKYLTICEKSLPTRTCVENVIVRIASAILLLPLCAAIDLTLNVIATVIVFPLFLEDGSRHLTNIAAAIALFVKAPFLLFGAPFPQTKTPSSTTPTPALERTPQLALEASPPTNKTLTPEIRVIVSLIAKKSPSLAKAMQQSNTVDVNYSSDLTYPSGWTYTFDHSQWTVLNWAVDQGYTEIAEKLLEAGADVNRGDSALSISIYRQQNTPSLIASMYEHNDIANGREKPTPKMDCLKAVLKHTKRISTKSWHNAIHKALYIRSAEAVQELVIAGKECGQFFDDVLHRAITFTAGNGWHSGNLEIFHILIKNQVGLYNLFNKQTVMERFLKLRDDHQTEKANVIVELLKAGVAPESAHESWPSTVEVLQRVPAQMTALRAHHQSQMDALGAALPDVPKELLNLITDYVDGVNLVLTPVQQ